MRVCGFSMPLGGVAGAASARVNTGNGLTGRRTSRRACRSISRTHDSADGLRCHTAFVRVLPRRSSRTAFSVCRRVTSTASTSSCLARCASSWCRRGSLRMGTCLYVLPGGDSRRWKTDRRWGAGCRAQGSGERGEREESTFFRRGELRRARPRLAGPNRRACAAFQVELFSLLRLTVFEAATTALFGARFMESHGWRATALDFDVFERGFEMAASPLPQWLQPRFCAARRRLLRTLR